MTMDMMNATIRCSSTLDSPPGLMFTWETSKWLFEDPAGDYASDIELFGMPEILGAGSNILAMFVVWAVVGRLDEYQTNARRCLQYMLLYLLAFQLVVIYVCTNLYKAVVIQVRPRPPH